MKGIAGWMILLVLAVAWSVTLRPTQLGGPTTMIVVAGDSMEPTLSDGDLVVLREKDGYDVGGVVTFPVPEGEAGAGTLVIHRIVGREGDGFVLRGDNRDRVDEWRPSDADIKGELWVHVPQGGDRLMAILQPPLLAALAGGAATMWFLLRDSKPTRTKDDDA